MLAAAHAYAARGWPVFPIHGAVGGHCTCGLDNCPSPAKHPLTANGFKDASSDRDTITAWFRRWPSANVAVATGERAGIFILDVDDAQGLDDLQREHGALPLTLTQRTGSGGEHLLFAHPGFAIRNRGRFAPGLDVRGDAGYAVLPPSLHVSGRRYVWANDLAPSPAPEWLLGLVRKPKHRPLPALPTALYRGTDIGTPYGRAVLRGELLDLATAVQGERNQTLFIAACRVFSVAKAGELDLAAAQSALEHGGAGTGLDASEVRRTVQSALRIAEPRARQRPAYTEGGVAAW